MGIGLVLLLHGLGKLESGIGGTVGMVEGAGLPSWLAYCTYLGEFVALLLIMVGKWSCSAGLVVGRQYADDHPRGAPGYCIPAERIWRVDDRIERRAAVGRLGRGHAGRRPFQYI